MTILDSPFALFLALLVFGLSVFGVGCLSVTAFLLYRKVKRTSISDARFLRDATHLMLCSAAFLLIEAATLVWDTTTHIQFPLAVRWICLLVLVPTCANAAVRLLRYYLEQIRIGG